MRAGREQLFDLPLDGFEVVVEQTGLYLFEQLLGGKHGVEFRCIEPHSGQFENLAVLCVVVVAVAGTVVFDRRVEIQLHVFDDALDRGARAFEFLFQHVTRDGATARRNDMMQFIDTL